MAYANTYILSLYIQLVLLFIWGFLLKLRKKQSILFCIVVPFLCSFIAYSMVTVEFYWIDEHNFNIFKIGIFSWLFVALFFPYIVSFVWAISISYLIILIRLKPRLNIMQ
jgi:hypothetical protein